MEEVVTDRYEVESHVGAAVDAKGAAIPRVIDPVGYAKPCFVRAETGPFKKSIEPMNIEVTWSDATKEAMMVDVHAAVDKEAKK